MKFNKIIYTTFRVDALKYPTISSLAFAIFRTNYLKPLSIPIITGRIYDFIKNGYSGGSVDVYKPFGKNINCYDVNSLYPSQMLKQDMPVGNPIFFEGDISKIEKDPFGFFEVEIKTPNDLNVPILQTRVKINSGYKTIAPLGN